MNAICSILLRVHNDIVTKCVASVAYELRYQLILASRSAPTDGGYGTSGAQMDSPSSRHLLFFRKSNLDLR
jgi:hypothetical protein